MATQKDNIKGLLDNRNFKLIEYDISRPLFLEEDLDWVLHLASLASPGPLTAQPITAIFIGVLRFFVASSISNAVFATSKLALAHVGQAVTETPNCLRFRLCRKKSNC